MAEAGFTGSGAATLFVEAIVNWKTEGLKPVLDQAKQVRDEALKSVKELSAARQTILASGQENTKELIAAIDAQIKQQNAILGIKPPTATEGFFKSILGTIDQADAALKRFGFSFRGLSILFGAGLAGGLTAVIRVGEKLAETIIQVLDREKELEKQTNLTFGSLAGEASRFANNFGDEVHKVSEDILEIVNAAGLFGRSLGLSGEVLFDFSKQFAQLAEGLFNTEPGFKSVADVQKTMQEAINGSNEAFQQLGVSTKELIDVSLREFGKFPDELSKTERASLLLRDKFKEAIGGIKQEAAGGGDAFTKLKELAIGVVREINAELTELGESFVAWAKLVASATESVSNSLAQLAKPVADIFQPLADEINQFFDKIAPPDPKKFRTFSKEFLETLAEQNSKSGELAQAELERRAKQQKSDELSANSVKRVTDAINEQTGALFTSIDQLDQAVQAVDRYTEAQTEGAQKVADAREHLKQVITDNEIDLARIQEQNRRSLQDADRSLQEAEEAVTRAAVDRKNKVIDANERIEDAERTGSRNIRSIHERIQDEEREHARKVEDIQRRLAKAHKDTSNDILEAEIAVQRAQRRGTGIQISDALRALARAKEQKDSTSDLADAQRDLAREQEDFAIKHGRLVRDETEAEEDSARAIARARRERDKAIEDADRSLAQAQERIDRAREDRQRVIEDNQRRLTDFEIKSSRELRSASKAIEDSTKSMEKNIQSTERALDKLANKVGLTVEELIVLAQEFQAFGGDPQAFQIISALGIPFLPGRMSGGPVSADRPFIVGEAGPELFIPRSSGSVVSNDDLLAALKELVGQGSGPGHNFTIIDNTGHADAIAAAVIARQVRGVG